MSANLDAIKKAIVQNLSPGEVPVGLHQFDDVIELHVHGAAKRAEDSFIKPTAALPIVEILALVIAKAGIMGPHILDLIREAAAEAQKENKPIAGYLDTTKKAIRQVQDELIAGMTMIQRAGAFKGVVDVKVLSVR